MSSGDAATRQQPTNNRWLTYLLLASLLYLAVQASLGRWPHVEGDEIYYKAAGRQWAATGHFAALELRGAHGLEPPFEKIWLTHPPIYPYLFGCVVKLFGFGWRQCVVYDAVIHVCLALLTFEMARRLSGGGDRRAAFWAGLAVLPQGVLGRPDELASCFGMAGLLFLVGPMAGARLPLSMAAVLASGGLFGLCAGTSLPAAVVLSLIALVFLIAHAGTPTRFFILGLCWAWTAATVLAGAIAPVLAIQPDAYQQHFSMMKIIFMHRVARWTLLAEMLTWGKRFSIPVFGILLLGLATVVDALRRGAWRRWALLWLGPLLAAVFLLAQGPRNVAYPWMMGPYVLAAAMVTLTDPTLAPGRFRACIAKGWVAFLVLFGSMETVKQTVILATLPETQSLEYNARLIRELIPRGSTVVTYEGWWSLANDYQVLDEQYLGFIPLSVVSDAEYFVVQEPRLREFEDDYVKKRFRVIHDNRDPGPCTLFGVPLSHQHTGFGARIYARR
jgi:hypothetical protein